MGLIYRSIFLILLISPFCHAQDPMPVLGSSWQRTTVKAKKSDPGVTSPARVLTDDDKYFQRKTRESRTDNPMDPNRESMEARSASIDKALQESRAPKTDNVSGYLFTADLRNDTGKGVEVIFWEYRFTELARPQNVTRRQFLCAVKLKKGESRELSAFSLLGPSDIIDAESLAKSSGPVFDEKVLVNRIEFSDDSIIQRSGWKYDEVKKDVERATSTPWGRETCRAL